MRLIHAAAALRLLASHVLGQQWEDHGAMPDLSRRLFYEDFAHPPSLAKRDGGCGAGNHPCSDINSTLCCSNDRYCIVNETTYEPACCALGSTCGQQCGTDAYYANITTTTTISSTPKVETVYVCRDRSCTSTNYLCAESFGGNCCPYGADCASGRQCLVPSTSSSSSLSMSTISSEIPAGCSLQGQTYCTGAGRCCNSGYSCTEVSASYMCAQITSTSTPTSGIAAPTGSGVTVEHTSHGLSAGAKAGIAIGVIVAAALITGALTYLCIRRHRRTSRSTNTGQEMASGIGAGPESGTRLPGGPSGPRAYRQGSGQVLSETGYAPSSTQMSNRSGPLRRLTNDYFGVAAGHGPYTERAGEATTTPEYLAQPVTGDGQTPHGPDQIIAPVEIGSDSEKLKDGQRHVGSSEGGSELDGTELAARPYHHQQQPMASLVRDSIAGVFELYGSEAVSPGQGRNVNTRAPQPLGTPGSEMTSELGTPSPMSHEELQLQQQQQQQQRAE
ncbi:hypothetical protein VM1G_09986 [Cytospora mali]|uniref:Uncharacterized protein n=1 Tax=Cytospora mali TaxID=578113 RepID=A0A194WCD5_CYTMA|nr:hypothetical protein VM1G_09986 [Valsa mali]